MLLLAIILFLFCGLKNSFNDAAVFTNNNLNNSNNWCSNDIIKENKKCLCERFTHDENNLPASIALCNALNIKVFPSDLSLLFPNDLTILDLSMNEIQFLESPAEAADDESIASLTLKKLIISYNFIEDLSENFFAQFPALNHLDLSHNNLSSLLLGRWDGNIFAKQKNLIYLDLSYNNFKQLPDGIFANLIKLQTLDLSYNFLGQFLGRSNDILSRNLGITSNLTDLKLNNVELSDLHPDYFSYFNNLKHLELQDNDFNAIPTVPSMLEFFDLSGNNLSFISARYLNYHSLQVLKLSRMKSLESIHHYAFYNLQSLTTLILTDCPNLTEFTDLAFGLASKTMEIHPRILILARNGIRSLNATYSHMFRKMSYIDLRHNPWNCDCNILWLQEFGTDLYRGQELKCASPRNIRKKRLLELNHKDLNECYPEIYGKTSHKVVIIILMITIIFLMFLIFYLMRYPQNWMTSREIIGIGPNSPYNVVASTQDTALAEIPIRA